MKKDLIAVTLAAAFAAIPMQAAAMTLGPYTDSITGGPTYPDRMYRTGIASDCSGSKTFPGPLGETTGFKSYGFYNIGAAECITVSWHTDDSSYRSFLSAYGSLFDPTNLGLNYLGDAGSSAGTVEATFSFLAPAESTFYIVANTVFGRTSNLYTFSVTGDSIARAGEAPEPGSLVLLALGLLGLGALRRKFA